MTTRVEGQGWLQCVLVSVLAVEAVLITEDMGALLVCNLLQSQDVSIQTDANASRVVSDSSPSLGLLERRLETMTWEAIPLMPRNSGSGWATREMGAAFTMGGACECASCYACANLPRTVPKSYWSWPVANYKGSIPTYTVVNPNMIGVHVPRCLYACLVKTEVPDWHVSECMIETKTLLS